MKTKSSAALRSLRSSLVPVFVSLASTLLFASTAHAADLAAPTDKSTPKEYNMFVGTELTVVWDKQVYPVVQANGDILTVKIGDKNEKFDLRKMPGLRAIPSLKLTRSFATIANFDSAQIFSQGNNPHQQWATAMNVMMSLDDKNADRTYGPVSSNSILQQHFGDSTQPIDGKPPTAAPKTFGSAAQGVPSNPSLLGLNAINALGEETYDALRIKFAVSAERRIANPYLVIIVDITDPAKSDETSRWFHVKTLREISPEPQKIFISEEGFPVGFQVKKTSVHLFANGNEIATNMSEGLLPMSREAAHEYLVIQYIVSHKGASLQPSPALTELPSGFRQRVTPSQLNQKVSLKITAEGKVAEVASTDATGEALDPYIEETVRNFLFNPAMNNGKPIDATFKGTLADLVP